MTRYSFIAVPIDGSRSATQQHLQSRIQSYAQLAPITLPELKVGTLDALVVLSDEMVRADTAAEAVALKIADNLRSLLDNAKDQFENNLVVHDSIRLNRRHLLTFLEKVDAFLKSFQWNAIKYRPDKSLKELADTLIQEISGIEQLIKNKMNTYSSLKSSLAGMERKQAGNLAVRNLSDVVKREHFVLDSEFLVTLIVAVPKSNYKDWFDKYETLTNMVVPRSSAKIAEDDEYGLFNVTLFQRVADEFVAKAREAKFTPRDFKFDEERIANEKKEQQDIGALAKEQSASLIRLCRTNFGEVFSAWVHLKLLRIFVESVLRYGLPPNFHCMLIKPDGKHEKKVRDVLNQTYAHLAGAMGKMDKDDALDEVQGMFVDKDFFPYVNFDLNWEL